MVRYRMQKRTRSRRHRSTRKHRDTCKRKVLGGKKSAKTHVSKIASVFLEMLNIIKIYHWNTYSYSQHEATDELYDKLNKNIDKFVEVLLGKNRVTIDNIDARARLVDMKNLTTITKKIHEYREFLIDMTIHFDKRDDTDLMSIRDEILGDVNQFLYLMTFDK